MMRPQKYHQSTMNNSNQFEYIQMGHEVQFVVSWHFVDNHQNLDDPIPTFVIKKLLQMAYIFQLQMKNYQYFGHSDHFVVCSPQKNSNQLNFDLVGLWLLMEHLLETMNRLLINRLL